MAARTQAVQHIERAVLAAVDTTGNGAAHDLEELRQLVDTAGAQVVGELTQRRDAPNPVRYFGKGKIEELAELVRQSRADLVIVDDDLSAVQQHNIVEVVDARVIDRTELILDIFAQRARTREGKLQVELAQHKYLLPRITSVYTRFEQQRGGIGLRGPGETKMEADRSRIRRRIADLERQIAEVARHRRIARAKRERLGLPTAALVGYTSAGKSTLLNALTGADVYTDPKLFATLDPTTRRVDLPSGRVALVSDTVGFIRKLPHHLVAAFRATLEETVQSTVLLHVVDVSHPQMRAQMEAVLGVLNDLHVGERPILTVLNKIDLVKDTYTLREMVAKYPDTVYLSALTGNGLIQLLRKLEQVLAREERRAEARRWEERRAYGAV
ncbi:MAG: GTPase HflX [Armatimonadetes bacterium]|nr:GTPase HflX [Armatimonadota bacterium]